MSNWTYKRAETIDLIRSGHDWIIQRNGIEMCAVTGPDDFTLEEGEALTKNIVEALNAKEQHENRARA